MAHRQGPASSRAQAAGQDSALQVAGRRGKFKPAPPGKRLKAEDPAVSSWFLLRSATLVLTRRRHVRVLWTPLEEHFSRSILPLQGEEAAAIGPKKNRHAFGDVTNQENAALQPTATQRVGVQRSFSTAAASCRLLLLISFELGSCIH